MLWHIAQRYGTTTQAIIRENQIENPNMIYAGMQLRIPRAKPTIDVNAYTYQPSMKQSRVLTILVNF